MNYYASSAAFKTFYRRDRRLRSEWLAGVRYGTFRVRMGDDVNDMDTVYRLTLVHGVVREQVAEAMGVYSANLIGKTVEELREMMQAESEPPYCFGYDLVNRHRDYGNGHVVVD
jgi:hypothetical protein